MATPVNRLEPNFIDTIWTPKPNEFQEERPYPSYILLIPCETEENKKINISIKTVKSKKLLPKDLFNDLFRNK